jgi:hypothetical protein
VKYSSFEGNFEFREWRKVGRGEILVGDCGKVEIECFAKNCLIDNGAGASALS